MNKERKNRKTMHTWNPAFLSFSKIKGGHYEQ